MTAEVAILNRAAVALAADSAVTIGFGAQKVYNTVNKLFALSKYQPIGVMVYGGADLTGVPWESIIKVYRQQLGATSHARLQDYANDLASFLGTSALLFSSTTQAQFVHEVVRNELIMLVQELPKRIQQALSTSGPMSEEQVIATLLRLLDERTDAMRGSELFDNLDEREPSRIVERYMEQIDRAMREALEQLAEAPGVRERVLQFGGELFCRRAGPSRRSGVVVAGFGDEEIFPSLVELGTSCVVNDRLRFAKRRQLSVESSGASITPFAQGEMVQTFMEGINPRLRSALDASLDELFDKYPAAILDAIRATVELSEAQVNSLHDSLTKAGKQMRDKARNDLRAYRVGQHVAPVINAVQFLPRNELAEMAEALVNLTAFRQKVSLDTETVGGPIDVAVISKGDGFIWIKRKHYFQAELNPGFAANYYRRQRTRGAHAEPAAGQESGRPDDQESR